MTAAQQVEFVRGQVEKLRAGKSDSLKCPYCDMENLAGEEFCCVLFTQALAAVLHREGMQKVRDQAARVADAVSRN